MDAWKGCHKHLDPTAHSRKRGNKVADTAVNPSSTAVQALGRQLPIVFVHTAQEDRHNGQHGMETRALVAEQ